MKLDARKLEIPSGTAMVVKALMVLGVVTFAAGIFLAPDVIWKTYLVYHTLFMGFGIGALFFLLVHYLASAGWNVAVRRVMESFVSYIPIAALFNLVIFLGLAKIYPWTDHAYMESDHMLHSKAGYFGTAFFIVRSVVFFAVVCFFSWKLVGNSVKQDEDGALVHSERQKGLSALCLVLFAPLFTMFAVDTIKSLDPHWFSTMFGVYVFVGFVQATAAAAIVLVTWLKKQGYLSVVTADHYHDMGKYLFGFTIFWAYIGVSQYLLIWYANLPEETMYYLDRQRPGWVYFSILLPTVRFVLPFLLLLPRMAKRTPNYLVKVAYLVLFGAWLDVYWMIKPNYSETFGFSIWDIGLGLGFFGFFAFVVTRFLSANNTVPVKDPYLHETMHHHVF